jgi:transposase
VLTVTDINYIKQEVNIKGRSYSDVAKQMGRDPRTIKKYADKEDWNENQHKQVRKGKVMDPVKPIVDQWLQEDLKKKKKYRRTAKRIFDQLVNDYSFKGADRTVREYVAKRKLELLEDTSNAAIPLEAKPGTAQVDFGEAPFKHNGKTIDLPFLALSFPNSNAFYFQVFFSQNRECFLEGLKRIFHYIGGVPKAIRFDNLAPAVKKVLPNGERELTEEFQNFVFHYDFEPEFCNPASGNEKGHVEAMVKYIRNNFLLPELPFSNLEDLNKTFWQIAEKDRQRKHYQKDILITELYEEDKQALYQLPDKEYHCIRYEEVKADKYGYVKVDNRLYSTSPRFAKCLVLARISFNKVEILTEQHELIVVHSRLYGKQKKSMEWQPYLNLMAKRPTAIKYTSFYEQMPEEWQKYLENCTVYEKQEALRLLSVLLKEHDFTYATQALNRASESGHPSVDSIKQVFYQLINGRGHRKEIQVKRDIPSMPPATRGLDHYDQFFKNGGVS